MEDPQALLRAAVAALQSGRPAEARERVSRAIRQGADNASVWAILAVSSAELEDWTTASEAADRSIGHEPRNPRAYVVKGDAYHAAGEHRAAAAFYGDALKFAPPEGQGSPDLVSALQRARTRIGELQSRFARHLESHVEAYVAAQDAAGTPTDRMKLAVDLLLGRRRVYQQEPRHLFFPGLPLREFYDPAAFDWVPTVEAATDEIREELLALLADGASFAPYLEAAADRPVHDVHGMKDNPDWGALYLWYNGAPVPEIQARCPRTTAVMQQVPLVFSGTRCPNVLFSRLRAGAAIPPHTGMLNTRAICHLPLIVPEGCGFRVGNDVREWVPGKVWLFDDSVEHEAWNRSDQDRVILIFEVWTPELSAAERGLVTRLLEAVDSY